VKIIAIAKNGGSQRAAIERERLRKSGKTISEF